MGLLNTSAIMDEIGFSRAKRGKGEINEILAENGLSLEESIVEVKNIIDNTTDTHLKAKLLDLVLQMHGVKSEKNAVPASPSITFVFNTGSGSNAPFVLPSELRSDSNESIIDVTSEKEI